MLNSLVIGGYAAQMVTRGTRAATPRQIVRADAGARAQRAWSARVGGATWEQTAELAGYANGPAALRGVKNYFGQLPQLDREDLRDLWRDRLEVLWAQSVTDVGEQRSGAVRSAVAVAQRASALDGLDAPTKVAVTPSVQEFEAVVEAIVQHRVTADLGNLAVEGDIWAEEVAGDDEGANSTSRPS